MVCLVRGCGGIGRRYLSFKVNPQFKVLIEILNRLIFERIKAQVPSGKTR